MKNEENIAKLQKLLDAGVITQQEFDVKKAELTSEPTEEELSELTELLEKDLISKDEFEALKAKKKKDAVAAVITPKAGPVAETVASDSFLKKNFVFLIIIGVLVIALGVLFASKQSEINELKEQIKTQESATYDYKKRAYRYKDMLTEFYLDYAVVIVEGDSAYYHRYMCPDTPMATGEAFKFKTVSPWNAEKEGYKECPTCFGVDSDEFLKDIVADGF